MVGPCHPVSGGESGVVDLGIAVVPLSLPYRDLGLGRLPVRVTAAETLTPQNADLELDHVEPVGMIGRVVKFVPA